MNNYVLILIHIKGGVYLKNKIGSLRLCGLMIGPILGSGIILLPPIAYKNLGNASIWAWIIIMFLGALFAIMFSKLAIIYPGDGGMTIAVEKIFGGKLKLYSSFLLISAVSFGPSAVLLTAANYLNKLSSLKFLHTSFISIGLLIICLLLLLRDIKFVSTLSLVLSSIIVLVLAISSISILASAQVIITPVQDIEIIPTGKVVLLLFWAIIGWEIIGNYSEQVKNLNRTLPQATTISLVVITVSYILLALAVQAFPNTERLSLIHILTPLFGRFSTALLALLVTGLCISTYLLIVGAVGRLVSSLATEGFLFPIFKKKNVNNIPIYAILYFTTVHAIIFVLTYFDTIDIESIVSIANGFFLANALIGVVASIVIVDSIFFKVSGSLLVLGLITILLFSSIQIFLALAFIFFLSCYLYKKADKLKQDDVSIEIVNKA